MVQSKVEPESLPLEDLLYPLVIQIIPPDVRIILELSCRLIHQESGLQLPGHFTQTEANLIQKVSQHWDWSLDKNNKPACAARLLRYLEQLCAPSLKNKEEAV